jgi:hypothetical protein
MNADSAVRSLCRAICVGFVALFTTGLSGAQSPELDGLYAPFPRFQSAEAIVALVGDEADAALMVSESLKRYAAAYPNLAPATAAQFKAGWVHLSGVPLVRLSEDEALAVWNTRGRLLGILRIERHEKSLTFYIGPRACYSADAVAYRFTPTRGAWLVSTQFARGFAVPHAAC